MSSSTDRSDSSRVATARSWVSSKRSCTGPTWSSSTSLRQGSTRFSRTNFGLGVSEQSRLVPFFSFASLDEAQHVRWTASPSSAPAGSSDIDAVESLRERALRHVTVTFRDWPSDDPFAGIDGVRPVSRDERGPLAHAPRPPPPGRQACGFPTPFSRFRLSARRSRGDLPRALQGGRRWSLRCSGAELLYYCRALVAWCVGIAAYAGLTPPAMTFPSIDGSVCPPAWSRAIPTL